MSKTMIGTKIKLNDGTLGKIITPLSTGGYVMEVKETQMLREIDETEIIEIIKDGFTLYKAIMNLISFVKSLFSKKTV